MANLLTCDGISPRQDGLAFNLSGLGIRHSGKLCVLVELDEPYLYLLSSGVALSLVAEGFGAKGPTRLLLHEWRTVNSSTDWYVLWWATSGFPTGVWRLSAMVGEREVCSRPVSIGG